MTLNRLNSVAVCQSHQDMLDSADISALMREFSSCCDARLKLFGRWH